MIDFSNLFSPLSLSLSLSLSTYVRNDVQNPTLFVMAADTLFDSDQIFSKLPEDIIEKILSCVTLKQRPTISLVSKKWWKIIQSFEDDLNLVYNYSAKIACGYCGSSQSDRQESCLCSDTDLYHVDPFIKLAADKINFKELYLFIPPNFRYCASPKILDSIF